MENQISESYKSKLQKLAGILSNSKVLNETNCGLFKGGNMDTGEGSMYPGGVMKITDDDFKKLSSEDKGTFKPEQKYKLIGWGGGDSIKPFVVFEDKEGNIVCYYGDKKLITVLGAMNGMTKFRS